MNRGGPFSEKIDHALLDAPVTSDPADCGPSDCGPSDCVPDTAGLPAECVEAIAALCRVLSDPQRVRILSVLATTKDGVCVCDLADAVGRSQPTASYHLKKLEDAGLLEREARGKWAFYAPTTAAFDALVTLAHVATDGAATSAVASVLPPRDPGAGPRAEAIDIRLMEGAHAP